MGGTGQSVVVSLSSQRMFHGACAAVQPEVMAAPAMVVSSSMVLTQGWVAHSMGQSVAE